MHNSKTCHILEVNSLQTLFHEDFKGVCVCVCVHIDPGGSYIKIILICRNLIGNKMT